MRKAVLIILAFYPLLTFAQETELLESINFQKAVLEGTRTRDGRPGSKYWQNHADYDISVRLDTAEKKIYGKEHITYYNNSPDKLANIVIRLFQNRNKKGAVRDMEVHPGNIHDGMELDTIIINGQGIMLASDRIKSNGTNLFIPLENPLPSKGILTLYCSWNYKIPTEQDFRRTGYYKDNSWFIGYFYPQIAVYDDMEISPELKGWDYMLFHKGMQEFYNDFNNYQMAIEVPEGFFVWATGDLKNAEDVYSQPLLDRLDEARNTDGTVHILSADDLNSNLLLGNKWEFEAINVTDFGFGTAKNYLWDGTSVSVGDHRVFVDVAYHPESKLYPQVIDIARNTIKYTSEIFPGIQFPYGHATTFNGMLGGGMEFPMIVNNSDVDDTTFLRLMSSHELIHNYFPFMMGINEKRYHFLDEGFTEFFSIEFLWDQYHTDFYTDDNHSASMNGIFDMYSDTCVPTQDDFSLFNAYAHINTINVFYQYYVKPVVAYMLFMEMVGEDKFLNALREFVKRWRGKHPTPYDLFYTFNDVLNENYNWYWNTWFLNFGYPDLGIELQDKNIVVKRMGPRALPLPVNITIKYIDGTSSTIARPMNIWKSGERQIRIEIEDLSKIKSVALDYSQVPDIDHSNNYLEIN